MANKYFTTPRGIASYPKLIKPDTKFNPEGTYSVGLTFPAGDAVEAFIEHIEEVFADEMGEKKLKTMVKPYKIDSETGEYLFKFKSANKPQLFDAAGKPIRTAADIKLGSGSVLKIKGSIGPCTVKGEHYATLYLNSVQVIDLIEFNANGFTAEDGTYSADNDTTGDDDGVPELPGDDAADDDSEAKDF